MANKTFNTRVKNKRDTAANWEAVATTFQPLDGELIIVDTSAGKTRFKVGRYDTAKGRLLYYNEIPFADEYLYNDLNESQGKIYDKLKGIDDKSIIESTLEPSTGTTAVKNYNIGIWQFPKTGFYKIKLSQLGTNITFLRLYARKTKDDGTLPEEDFSNDNLVFTSGAGGDGQLEYIYILADYLDTDSLTAYKIQFLNPIFRQGITWVNTYDKTTQKWSFTSAANVNAKNVSNDLTLTKGDTKTVYDGSVAREISIPTKTSELTNDSFVSYAEQTLTEDQQNQAKTNLGIDIFTGNTTTVTPTQVKEAILAGRPIAITYVDNTYGNLTFTSFGYSLENNVVVANLVATSNGQYILADLTGMSNTNSWTLQTTELGTSTDIANNYVKYSEFQTLTDGQKAQARTNIGAISSSEVSSNYLSLDNTQELTEIQKDVLRSKLNYLNEVRVAGNWKGITAEERKNFRSSSLTIIQGPEHDEADSIPSNLNYPILLVPHRVTGTLQTFYALTANGDSYICSLPYPSFNFSVSKLEMNQQTMKADPTEDMQIATKKYVDNSSVQSDWNQNDTTAKDYIKNRICYEEETVTELGNTAEVWHNLTNGLSSTPISYRMNGKIYKDLTATNGGGSDRIVYNGSVPEAYLVVVNYYSDVSYIKLNYPSNVTDFQFVKIENTVKQIDSKFIPTASPDWNQNDETAKDYIKNRPGAYYTEDASTSWTNLTSSNFQDMTEALVSGSDATYQCTSLHNLSLAVNDVVIVQYTDTTGSHEFIAEIKSNSSGSYTHVSGQTFDVRNNILFIKYNPMAPIIVVVVSKTQIGFMANNNTITAVNVKKLNVVKIPEYFLDLASVQGFDPSKNYTAVDKGSLKYTSKHGSTIIGINEESAGIVKWPRVEVSMNELDTSYVATTQYTAGAIYSSWEDSSTNNFVHGININHDVRDEALILQSKLLDNTTEDLSVIGIATPTQDNSAVNKKYVDDQITTVNNKLGGLTGAMHFIGKATVDITDGSTTDPVITDYDFTNKKEKGDVILGKDDHKEFVWNGATWEELGDEGSYALKTTTINGKALSGNITLTASDVGAASASTIETMQAAIDSKPSAADAVYTATAASTDGVAYTATVSGIDSLTVGASFIMIPNKASTSKAPTLNVNGLGAKPIRRRLSSLTTSLQQGYSTNWIALNKPFTVVYDGTAWVIEGLTKTDGADVYGAVAQATADAKGNNIADTYATIAMLQSLLPKVTTITLTSNWVGDASPYYQDIALSCVTETSIVDLQPTPEQLNSWQDDGIAFTTLSGNGTVRVYVAGGKPSSAISVQVRVQEVTVI